MKSPRCIPGFANIVRLLFHADPFRGADTLRPGTPTNKLESVGGSHPPVRIQGTNGRQSPGFVALLGPIAVLSAPNGAPSVPDSLPTRLMAPQKQCQEQGGFSRRLTSDDSPALSLVCRRPHVSKCVGVPPTHSVDIRTERGGHRPRHQRSRACRPCSGLQWGCRVVKLPVSAASLAAIGRTSPRNRSPADGSPPTLRRHAAEARGRQEYAGGSWQAKQVAPPSAGTGKTTRLRPLRQNAMQVIFTLISAALLQASPNAGLEPWASKAQPGDVAKSHVEEVPDGAHLHRRPRRHRRRRVLPHADGLRHQPGRRHRPKLAVQPRRADGKRGPDRSGQSLVVQRAEQLPHHR